MNRILIAIISLFVSSRVSAAGPCPDGKVCIDTGVHSTVPSILQGFISIQIRGAVLLTLGLFLLGAVIMVGSGGEEAYLSAGKKIMKAAIIGLVIILSSWLILETVISFIAS